MFIYLTFKLLTTSSRHDWLKVIPFSGTYVSLQNVTFVIYVLLISQFKEFVSAVWKIEALISRAATPGIQASGTDWRTQTRALIPLWDFRSPHCPSHIPSPVQQLLQASLPPRINYSQSPAAPALASVTPEGVTESGRSEVALPTATHGTSQKSVYQKPCGDPPIWPLESWGRSRDPPLSPVLLNNGLFHSNLVGCLCDFNHFVFGFIFLASFSILNGQTIIFCLLFLLFNHLVQL